MTTIKVFQRIASAFDADADEDEVELPEDRSLWRKILDLLGFGLAGVAHPRDKLSVDEPPPREPEA